MGNTLCFMASGVPLCMFLCVGISAGTVCRVKDSVGCSDHILTAVSPLTQHPDTGI